MSTSSFSYAIYIHATPEEVWSGLVHPVYTRAYWFHEFETDWQVGSRWLHRRTDEAGTVSVEGEILEIEPERRLVLSWAPPGTEEPAAVSRVAFELTEINEWPHGPWTGVTLEHSELQPDSDMLKSITFGWPAVMSGLKSVIERPDIFEAE